MTDRTLGNHLKMHRRKAGLSQRELGQIVGYKRQWAISRHERSQTAPPLLVALAYEAIFGVPVSKIFIGFRATVAHVVEKNIAAFEKELADRKGKGRMANETAQKLEWLTQRRKLV